MAGQFSDYAHLLLEDEVTRYVKIQPVLPAKGRVGVLKTNAKKPS